MVLRWHSDGTVTRATLVVSSRWCVHPAITRRRAGALHLGPDPARPLYVRRRLVRVRLARQLRPFRQAMRGAAGHFEAFIEAMRPAVEQMAAILAQLEAAPAPVPAPAAVRRHARARHRRRA